MRQLRIAARQASDRCPQCGKRTLVEDAGTGEVSCDRCGFVITERALNQGPEWRSFAGEESENKGVLAPRLPSPTGTWG